MSETTLVEARADIVSNVWKLLAGAGDAVAQGDVVAVLESMKMEIPVHAAVGGTVAEVLVTEGTIVQEGDVLLRISPSAG